MDYLLDLDDESYPDVAEDYLKIDTVLEDYPSAITETSSSSVDHDTTDDYPGWNAHRSLTMVHSGKPNDWSSTSTYSAMILFGLIIEFGKILQVVR